MISILVEMRKLHKEIIKGNKSAIEYGKKKAQKYADRRAVSDQKGAKDAFTYWNRQADNINQAIYKKQSMGHKTAKALGGLKKVNTDAYNRISGNKDKPINYK